ncbi:MAG: RluA family pseudouridine synthase, partial [Atopostipes suicloacalis]|nr:RluA family pseudouridine synthase [Atopostipes suicloacalis]
NLNVLYEDNHLLIVEKDRNLLVQEDISGDPDLLNIGKEFLVKKYNKPGDAFLGLVHRLDRPVGGIILFAKTSKAASRISNEIRLNRFDRSYLAVVRGTSEKKEGKLTDFLLKDRRKNKSAVVDPSTDGAKKAILRYHVLAANSSEDLSLISIELETGRSHQIRLQLAHMGHPIYGDQKYGQNDNKVGQQIALWAQSLAVKHPTKDEIIQLSVNPPLEYPWNLFKIGK